MNRPKTSHFATIGLILVAACAPVESGNDAGAFTDGERRLTLRPMVFGDSTGLTATIDGTAHPLGEPWTTTWPDLATAQAARILVELRKGTEVVAEARITPLAHCVQWSIDRPGDVSFTAEVVVHEWMEVAFPPPGPGDAGPMDDGPCIQCTKSNGSAEGGCGGGAIGVLVDSGG